MLLNNGLYFRVLLQPLEYVLVWLSTGSLTQWCPALLLPDQGFQWHEIAAAAPRLSSFGCRTLLQSAGDVITSMISCIRAILTQSYHFFLSLIILFLLGLLLILSHVRHLSYWSLFIKVIVDRELVHDVFALRGRPVLRFEAIEYPGNKTSDIFFLILEKLKQRLNNLRPCLIFVDC